MSNPFKVGDKVVRLNDRHGNYNVGDIGTVTAVSVRGVELDRDVTGYLHQPYNLRAAIAGQDYDVPAQPNTGHLPDGSSVQKHSAGPIYPCVITLREKRLKGTGLFDYGITSPRNLVPVWLSTLEAAHAVADIINKDTAQ